jgi:hypothetical protein
VRATADATRKRLRSVGLDGCSRPTSQFLGFESCKSAQQSNVCDDDDRVGLSGANLKYVFLYSSRVHHLDTT